MDFINSLFGMGTTSVVLLGAFFIAFIGYALGSIQVKGVSLGTLGIIGLGIASVVYQSIDKLAFGI